MISEESKGSLQTETGKTNAQIYLFLGKASSTVIVLIVLEVNIPIPAHRPGLADQIRSAVHSKTLPSRSKPGVQAYSTLSPTK